jgi:hypothetical protein
MAKPVIAAADVGASGVTAAPEVRPRPYNIGEMAAPASSFRSDTRSRIRDASGRVVLDSSREERIIASANQIAFYQGLEREGKGNILQPEGRGGPLIWAPKRSDREVEHGLRAKYDVALADIIDSDPDRRGSYYVNGAGTDRTQALMKIAETGELRGRVLTEDDMQEVKSALVAEQASLRDKLEQREKAINEVLDKAKKCNRFCNRNEAYKEIPKELRSPFKINLDKVTSAIARCDTRIEVLRAAESSTTNAEAGAGNSSTTSATVATSSPLTPSAPSVASAAEPISRPQTTATQAHLPVAVANSLRELEDPNSQPAQSVISECTGAIARATTQAARTFQEALATQRLDALKHAETINSFYETKLQQGEHSVEHTVNLASASELFTTLRIDFTNELGDHKSFVYNPHKASALGETGALTAAQQGILFDKTSLPSGYPAEVKLTFTQPGRYNVNGEEIIVPTPETTAAPQASLTPQPTRSPYQEFSVGKDARQVHLQLNNEPLTAVNLTTIPPGQFRKVGENLEVHRLENGEVRIKCFAGGKLDVISALASGTQTPYSFQIKPDPNMQSYYELQEEIARANKVTDSAERFNALHACKAKVDLLQASLDPQYKTKLNNSLKDAQVEMWDDALNKSSDAEDFLTRLNAYEAACREDQSLYPLPDHVKARLRRDAQLRSKPKALMNNPFALTS